MASAVTQKGQVTIPKHVRDAMGIRPGALVEVESDGQGGARIVKIAPAPVASGWARFRGIGRLPDGLNPDDYMANIRDPLDA